MCAVNNPNNLTAQSCRGFATCTNKNVAAIISDILYRLLNYYDVFSSPASSTDRARSAIMSSDYPDFIRIAKFRPQIGDYVFCFTTHQGKRPPHTLYSNLYLSPHLRNDFSYGSVP